MNDHLKARPTSEFTQPPAYSKPNTGSRGLDSAVTQPAKNPAISVSSLPDFQGPLPTRVDTLTTAKDQTSHDANNIPTVKARANCGSFRSSRSPDPQASRAVRERPVANRLLMAHLYDRPQNSQALNIIRQQEAVQKQESEVCSNKNPLDHRNVKIMQIAGYVPRVHGDHKTW